MPHYPSINGQLAEKLDQLLECLKVPAEKIEDWKSKAGGNPERMTRLAFDDWLHLDKGVSPVPPTREYYRKNTDV